MMREQAVTACQVAHARYETLSDQCICVKGAMEPKYGGIWCCFMSEKHISGSYVSYDNAIVYFKMNGVYILIFKMSRD